MRYATLAPNSHNTHPWRFEVARGQLIVTPDYARRTPVVDPDDHHLFVTLGCAAENAGLAARALGMGGQIDWRPEGGGANAVQMADPAFMKELKHWIRFDEHEAMRTRDGLFAGCTGNPSLPRWLGVPLFDLFVTARRRTRDALGGFAARAGLLYWWAGEAIRGTGLQSVEPVSDSCCWQRGSGCEQHSSINRSR